MRATAATHFAVNSMSHDTLSMELICR